MNTPTEIREVVAYDYSRQTWIYGQAAVDLRRQQLSEEISLLSGPTGEEYASFVGVNRFTALDLLQGSLAKLQ